MNFEEFNKLPKLTKEDVVVGTVYARYNSSGDKTVVEEIVGYAAGQRNVDDVKSWLSEPQVVTDRRLIRKGPQTAVAKVGDKLTKENAQVGMVFTNSEGQRMVLTSVLDTHYSHDNKGHYAWNHLRDDLTIVSLPGTTTTKVGDRLTKENAKQGMTFQHKGQNAIYTVIDSQFCTDLNGNRFNISYSGTPASIVSIPGVVAAMPKSEPFGWVDAPPDPEPKAPRGRCTHGYTECVRCDYDKKYYATETNAMAMTTADTPRIKAKTSIQKSIEGMEEEIRRYQKRIAELKTK